MHHQLSYCNEFIIYLKFWQLKEFGGNKRKGAAGVASEKAVRQTDLQSVQEQQANPVGGHSLWRVPAGTDLGLELQSMTRSQDGAGDSSGTLVLGDHCWSSQFLKDCTLWYCSPLGCKEDGTGETKYYGPYCSAQGTVKKEL